MTAIYVVLLLLLLPSADGFAGGFGSSPNKSSSKKKTKQPTLEQLQRQRRQQSAPTDSEFQLPPLSPETIASLTAQPPPDIDLSERALSQTGFHLQLSDVVVRHYDPLVLEIPNFLTADECNQMILAPSAGDGVMRVSSQTVDKNAASKRARQSTTFYHRTSEAFVSVRSENENEERSDDIIVVSSHRSCS